jgi:hypothetical protein
LLGNDHAEVLAAFTQYRGEDGAINRILARRICTALIIHAHVEEELFYPAVAQALEDDEVVDNAIDDHSEAKSRVGVVIAQLGNGSVPDDAMTQLERLVSEHVEDEERGMFPDMRQTKTGMYALGAKLASRKVDLLFDLKSHPS